jgi:DNA repair protein RadA/Sms
MAAKANISNTNGDNRLSVFSEELNSVLGGGIVKGSVVLLAGEPGIGKSTLLLQLAADLATRHGEVLYLSGEENPQQIAMRAKRLNLNTKDIFILSEDLEINNVFSQLQSLEKLPSLIIIDSIQTMSVSECTSSIGSTTQIRESTARLVQYAKGLQIPIVLIGHVTKSGDVAGPKVLEHMVDAVLYLKGSESSDYRIIKSEKNR